MVCTFRSNGKYREGNRALKPLSMKSSILGVFEERRLERSHTVVGPRQENGFQSAENGEHRQQESKTNSRIRPMTV